MDYRKLIKECKKKEEGEEVLLNLNEENWIGSNDWMKREKFV